MRDVPHADLELSLKAPYEHVAAACAGVRARIRRAERWRGAFILGLLGVLALVAVVLAVALGPGAPGEGHSRSMMLLWVLVLLSLAAPLYAAITRSAARTIERRKLEIAEHLLDVFGPEIPAKDVILELSFHAHHRTRPKEREGNTAHYDHEWLRLAFTLLNDTKVGVRCRTIAERRREGRELRERAFETLRVALILPNDDLFGPRRPEVTVSPPAGLSLSQHRGWRASPSRGADEIEVQGQAVLFHFRTPDMSRSRTGARWQVSGLENQLDGELTARAVEACRESVAGLRSFSQPPCHPPRERGPKVAPPAPSLAELLRSFWRRLTRGRDLDPIDLEESQARHRATVHEVTEGIAADLEVDLRPVASGIGREDLGWMSEAISENLWEWRARNEIMDRRGFMHLAPTHAQYRLELDDRVVKRLPAGKRAPATLPRLRWDPSAPTFPNVLDDRVRLGFEQPGVWLGVHEGAIVATGVMPGDERRVVAPLPANFDPERQAALAYDPGRKVIGLWMRCWARKPSRTFFWTPERGDWTEHRHPFRSEDEHAGATFLFDHCRDAFVRLGVTYLGTWTAEEEYAERPAGLMQLALSAKGRLAVSDPDTKTTLVLDLVHGRVVRSAPSGWALVAEIEPSETLESPPHPWSILSTRYRYDAARKWLLWQDRMRGGPALAMDLAPAFDRAASLDPPAKTPADG